MAKKMQKVVEYKGTIMRKKRVNVINKLKARGVIKSKRDVVKIKLRNAKSKKDFPTFVAVVKEKNKRKTVRKRTSVFDPIFGGGF